MPTKIEIDKYSINPYGYLRGLFTQTVASTPVTNTTAEQTLLGSGIGTITVPANGFKPGDSFHLIVTGHINSLNNQKLRIKVKADSIILADTDLFTTYSTTDKHFKLEVFFTIRSIGSSGNASIVTAGTFMYTKNASTNFEGINWSTETATGFDTTISNTLNVTAQWDNASVDNSIYSELITLTKTF